jgi:transposase
MVVAPELLSGLNAKQLRELARNLIAQVACRDQAKIDQLTHEMAVLKRWKFAPQPRTTRVPPRPACSMKPSTPTSQAVMTSKQLTSGRRLQGRQRAAQSAQPLPPDLPRREIRHEPESTICRCGCR